MYYEKSQPLAPQMKKYVDDPLSVAVLDTVQGSHLSKQTASGIVIIHVIDACC